MNLVAEGQIVGNHQVDDDLVQNLVLVASRSERRHQAGFHQAVDHVVFSLSDPGARGLQRTHILRVLAVVDGVVHLHADVLTVPCRQLEGVAPEVSLGLETHRFFAFNAGRLFNVYGDWQPYSGLHVHPPTIKVEVILGRVLGSGPGVGAVEADNIAFLILDPDAAVEPAHAGYLGVHVVNPSTDRAKELAAHKAEDIVLVVEAAGVQEHHLHEAGGRIGKPLQPERFCKTGNGLERTLEETVLFLGLNARGFIVSLVDEALGEVDTAQRILIVDRYLIELDIGLGVLDIGLNQGRALLDVLDQHLLARDGLHHQRGLFGSELVRLFVLRFLFCVRAGRTQGNDQEGEGDLPKRHVKLLG